MLAGLLAKRSGRRIRPRRAGVRRCGDDRHCGRGLGALPWIQHSRGPWDRNQSPLRKLFELAENRLWAPTALPIRSLA
jgi:hypothetical protein